MNYFVLITQKYINKTLNRLFNKMSKLDIGLYLQSTEIILHKLGSLNEVAWLRVVGWTFAGSG